MQASCTFPAHWARTLSSITLAKTSPGTERRRTRLGQSGHYGGLNRGIYGSSSSGCIVFQAFHRFAGVVIGEHLGYIFTATWSILLSVAITQTGVVPPVLGWLGILPAPGILVGVFEEAGFKPAGAVNAISYILWSLWLIALGIALLLR